MANKYLEKIAELSNKEKAGGASAATTAYMAMEAFSPDHEPRVHTRLPSPSTPKASKLGKLAKGLSKVAEKSGKANFEVDTSVHPDEHSHSVAHSEWAAVSSKNSDIKANGMFISGRDKSGAEQHYHYHPKTGLRKLKSLTWDQ